MPPINASTLATINRIAKKSAQFIATVNLDETMLEFYDELKNIMIYWIKQGVKIFRVDNPHTKDLSFWEWMISGIKNLW